MNDNRKAALRQALERENTRTLDEKLREELESEAPDGDKVRLILRILKERDGEPYREYAPETEAAWETYLERTSGGRRKGSRMGGWLLRAAAAAAVICVILLAVPQRVAAESFFERLMRWTDSIFELFSPGEEKNDPEYEFRTDNPGLQRVYDAVTELDITVPVVPMWIPDGYELVDCKVDETRAKVSVTSVFSGESKDLLIQIVSYSEMKSNEYYKDEAKIETIEIGGMAHNIMRNEDAWAVVWIKDNIECFIRIDCREDVLHRILTSIYTMEDE